MELECLKDNIQPLISVAERISGKNISLPILQTILLSASNGKIIIKATNLEVGFEGEVKGKIIKPGVVAVDAKTFSLLLNNLTKDEKLKITSENGNLIIKSTKTKSTLKGYIVDDFPLIPKPDGDKNIIDSDVLVSGIKSVIYAGSTSNIKPEIASVYIYQQNNNFYFVSTDSFRLAEKNYPSKTEDNLNPIIIPLKNSLEIVKVFEMTNSPITLQNNQNQLFLSSGELYLTSQIVNGVYPDYKQIMPKQFKTKININKDDLISTLKTANIFSDKFNQINIIFSNNKLIINSKNQDSGENSSEIEVKIEGEEGEVTLNAKYLLDGLQSINSQTVFIGFNERNKPLLIKGCGDESFNYLIMPVTR